MAKKLLNQKERWYADTHKEAEEIVADAKQDEALTMQKIHEKHNSKGFYYLVDLERTYSTAKEEMENRPEKDDAPDGQLTIDEVNSEKEDLPEFEDPFAGVEVKNEVSDEKVPF